MSYNYNQVILVPNNYINGQNQVLVNNINSINNPVLYSQDVNMNNLQGGTVYSTILLQEENINPKKSVELNRYNFYDNSSNSTYNLEEIKRAKSSMYKSATLNTFNRMKKNKSELESSGTLYISTRSKKHNKVIKNGKKIRNIDINDDCEDTMKDEDSASSYRINNRLKSDGNLTSKEKGNLKNDVKNKNSNETNETLKKDKNSNINENQKDKKSQNSKKEEDTKSKKSNGTSHNKAPFQRLTNTDFPIIPNGTNLFGTPLYNSNTNNTNNTYNTQNSVTDSYLTSNLGEYLEKELNSVNSLKTNEKLGNNKIGKGFKYCSEFTFAGKDPEGKTKIDQDIPLISLNIGGIQGFNLFGVLDGHGPHGHFVAQFCKEYFIKNMENYAEILRSSKGIINAEALFNELKNNGYSFLIDLYNQADLELTKQDTFDYTFSGTTCNIVFQFNNHLVCASVGDSRAILVYDKGDLTNQGIIPLSTDHKPDLPGEYERIQACGGMVDTIRDMYGNGLGPNRVYKAGYNIPGLAMSRALGDLQAKECGVIPTPQIIEYDINDNSKFMVICSDGVWEFMQNEQVRDLGNAFYPQNDIAGFCRELVNSAVNLWEQLEDIRDDITVVCVFF